MPRGRNGLRIVPADEVSAAIRGRCLSATAVAVRFGVAERTVRRWRRTGLPLYYGKRWITSDEWERFKSTGSPLEAADKSRTAARNLSVRSTRHNRTRDDRQVSARKLAC